MANLRRADYPGRTTMMKLSSVATLWDYINRAMPWNKPKSLSTEEVYAVTAYMLNMAGVVPDDHVLSDRNIAEAQGRLPNRNGMTTRHAMWPGAGIRGVTDKPDVTGTMCMSNCQVDPKIASMLPDFARNAHGNLAEQNRLVGPQRGANTTVAPGATPPAAAPVVASATAAGGPVPTELLQKHSCTACHAAGTKLVGPSWSDITKKHAGQIDYLSGKIKAGGVGVWGNIPMPPQELSVEDARKIAAWLSGGAGR